MTFSYEGIGEWCATFGCGEVTEGAVVKMDGSGAVKACSVQLGGMAKVSFTGTAPAAGYAKLAANGSGGVSVNNAGMSYLVVETDAENQVLTIKL